MPSISSLNTGVTGLNAQRRVLDVVSHNIANIGTEGYHRQRVELRAIGTQGGSALFSGGSRSYGVDASRSTRLYDELIAQRAMREDASRSMMNLASSTMSTIEKIFPEPGDQGIASQLDAFWGAWSAVATSPGQTAPRQELLAQAQQLSASLNRAAADLQAVADTAMIRMGDLAVDVNGLAQQVADMNQAISSSPVPLYDLMDRRDVVIQQIARLTGATTKPNPNGGTDVYIGNRALVVGDMVEKIDGASGTLRWVSDSQPVTATSGEAVALAATMTDIVPRYRTALDNIASTLVTGVNALHVVGYDQTSTTGRNFFDPANTTAATISLSADVAGQPGNIAAGAPVMPGPTAPGVNDGGQAREIARLADAAAGANAQYRSMITGLATETRLATTRAATQEQMAENAILEAQSIGSVNIDEEMANMVAAQRAYEANARVITVVDEMLAFLIERTGVVGR